MVSKSMSAKHKNVFVTYHSLIGKFFHGRDPITRCIKSQGWILGEPHPGYFLVWFFEWIAGQPSTRELVHITDMTTWIFYNSAEEMNDEWEYRNPHGHGLDISRTDEYNETVFSAALPKKMST